MINIRFLMILLCLLMTACTPDGEILTEPTPFAPIVLQGNDNSGQIQALLMADVADRTNLLSWQAGGWTGRDIKVGVLDRGFGDITDFEALSGRTVTIPRGDTKADYHAGSIIHGTQVLETVWSVAEEADLYACEYQTYDGYVRCIDWLIAEDVHIINHSAGVPALPLDGTGVWSRQVDRASNQGILWINAAGNFASGYYRGRLTDSNVNQLHEFRGNTGVVEALGVEAIGDDVTGVAMLSWQGADGIAANAIDIDLQILDAVTGQPIAFSRQIQNGSAADEALEYVQFDMSRDFAIQIIDVTGRAAGVPFALFVEFADLPGGEIQRSIIAPGDSMSALTIGALQGVTVADYSSRGPIETGAIKPDLTAPGEVRLADGTAFVGTSAAAPIVAGAAALIWQANPQYAQRDVRTFLLNALQDDALIFGADINYGNGRFYLSSPDGEAEPAEAIVLAQPTLTDTPAPRLTDEPTPAPQVAATDVPSIADDGTLTITVEAANLRDGPGTNYARVGSASSGDVLAILARTADSDWYLIEKLDGNPAWVWSGIVDVNTGDAQIEVAATIPATPEVVVSNNSQQANNNSAVCDELLARSRFNIGQAITPIGWARAIQPRPGIGYYWLGPLSFVDVEVGEGATILEGPICENTSLYWYIRADPYLDYPGYIREVSYTSNSDEYYYEWQAR